MNCGEVREIAAHGLCFACYRRNVREKEHRDVHTPSRQERGNSKKLWKAYSAVMQGCVEIGVQPADVLKMKSLLRPYLSTILHLIDHPTGEHHGEGQTELDGIPGTVRDEDEDVDYFKLVRECGQGM